MGAEELAQLAKLHTDGLLNDEQFEAAKNKALGLDTPPAGESPPVAVQDVIALENPVAPTPMVMATDMGTEEDFRVWKVGGKFYRTRLPGSPPNCCIEYGTTYLNVDPERDTKSMSHLTVEVKFDGNLPAGAIVVSPGKNIPQSYDRFTVLVPPGSAFTLDGVRQLLEMKVAQVLEKQALAKLELDGGVVTSKFRVDKFRLKGAELPLHTPAQEEEYALVCSQELSVEGGKGPKAGIDMCYCCGVGCPSFDSVEQNKRENVWRATGHWPGGPW
jgi:hypothetical protein